MSDNNEMPVIEEEKRTILARMRQAGFGKSLNIGIQYFAATKENMKQTNEGNPSNGGTSGAVICDPDEGRVDNAEQYVIPILQGPTVLCKGDKKHSSKDNGKNGRTRDDE